MVKKQSPWSETRIEGRFSGPYIHKSVPTAADDFTHVITERQHHAPDVLAYDLYGDWRLWKLIPDLNQLEDPTFDLVAGMTIRCPSVTRAKTYA